MGIIAAVIESRSDIFVSIQEQSRIFFGFHETLLLWMVTAILFVGTIRIFRPYSDTVTGFGDSSAYTGVASAIHHWNFRGLQIKQFWGYPYLVAVVAQITRLPDQGALLLVSFASSFLSTALAYRLWGGGIA